MSPNCQLNEDEPYVYCGEVVNVVGKRTSTSMFFFNGCLLDSADNPLEPEGNVNEEEAETM